MGEQPKFHKEKGLVEQDNWCQDPHMPPCVGYFFSRHFNFLLNGHQ